jgi:hypothetical protein
MLPSTPQTNVSQKPLLTRTSHVIRGAVLVICILLTEGILACGVCDLTRAMLDLWPSNLLGQRRRRAGCDAGGCSAVYCRRCYAGDSLAGTAGRSENLSGQFIQPDHSDPHG